MGEDVDFIVGLAIAAIIAGVVIHHWFSRIWDRRAWRRLMRHQKEKRS